MAFIWAGSSWLLGLALSSLAPLQLWQWLFLAACCICSLIFFRRDRRPRSLFVLLTLFFLGGARWAGSNPRIDQDQVGYYADIGYEVQLTGTIREDPDVRDTHINLELEIERIWISDLGIQKTVTGAILVQTSPIDEWKYGQRVKVTGILERPPEDGDFSYRAYLARQGILAWMPEANIRSLGVGSVNSLMKLLHQIRQRALVEIQRLFPYPEAPLLAGILLGIESRIPQELNQAYSRTGTTHIIAISGFNITILAGLVIAVFGRLLGRTRGLIAAGVVIFLYTLLVGADAPVVRAALMGTLALLARYVGRRTHGLTSLATAAVVMTFLSPQSIQDVGFQLSFAAALGLILYADPLGKVAITIISFTFPNIDNRRWSNVLAELFLFTLAAQITTLPVIIWHFHQISLISLLANALILPLQPLLMILSGIATILGLIWHPLGQLIGWFAWPFSALSNQVVSKLSALPGTVLYTGEWGIGWLLGYYTILFTLTALWWSKWKEKLFRHFMKPWSAAHRSVFATGSLIGLMLASLLVWHSVDRQPDGLLHITFMDVGRGEAILIRSPGGNTVLLNGGSSPVNLATELGNHLPYPNRQIDWLLIAGTKYHQLAGLREITAMTSIGQVLMSGNPGGSAYRRILDNLKMAEIPSEIAEVGMRLDLGDGSFLEVLTQGSFGVTFLLQYDHTRILLPTGLSPSEIPDLLSNNDSSQITAVLLTDGGYEAVNTVSLLEHYAPKLVLISCQTGSGDAIVDQLLDGPLAGTTILRTDLHGSIDLATDGQLLWVDVEHNHNAGASMGDAETPQ